MVAIIDTNIILDYTTRRQNHYENADAIIILCREQLIEGFIAAHSISDAVLHFAKRRSV